MDINIHGDQVEMRVMDKIVVLGRITGPRRRFVASSVEGRILERWIKKELRKGHKTPQREGKEKEYVLTPRHSCGHRYSVGAARIGSIDGYRVWCGECVKAIRNVEGQITRRKSSHYRAPEGRLRRLFAALDQRRVRLAMKRYE